MKAKRVAQAQVMAEARRVKLAAEKEQKEKARLARTERLAAAATAKAAAREAAAATRAEAAARQASAERAVMSQPNGYAQHAQQAVRRNGYHVPQSSLAQHQPIADAEAHGSHVLLPTAGSDPEVDIMFDTPEKAAATHERGSDASPEVDIICTSSQERHRNSLHSLQHRQQGQYPSGMQNKGQQDADADITHASPLTQWKDSRSQLQLRSRDDLDLVDVPGAFHGTQHQPDLALANGMRGHTRQEEEHGMHATTSEPDFDWAAWQSPEDAPAGISCCCRCSHSCML